tara:strand:- start:1014 stop:1550 length:537 start_codon:yes stop_codon:yes gene_type:complete
MKSKEITTFRKTYKDYDKQCYFEGLKLAVMFDEKDEVKRYGAQWDNHAKIWWMPVEKLTVDVHVGIGTVRDWLNDNKMIVGQYGRFNENAHTRTLFNTDESSSGNWTEYELVKDDIRVKVQFFYDQDVATFQVYLHESTIPAYETEFLNVDAGRERWDGYINAGHNRKLLTNKGNMIQ